MAFLKARILLPRKIFSFSPDVFMPIKIASLSSLINPLMVFLLLIRVDICAIMKLQVIYALNGVVRSINHESSFGAESRRMGKL